MHLLDDVWLLTIVAILIATARAVVPERLRDPVWAAHRWGLLAARRHPRGLHLASAQPTRAHTPWRRRGLAALHLLGVARPRLHLAAYRRVQNPLFLCVFALPVIGAIFVSRLASLFHRAGRHRVVTAVALGQVPELRWYASGLERRGALAREFVRRASRSDAACRSRVSMRRRATSSCCWKSSPSLLVRLRGGRGVSGDDIRAALSLVDVARAEAEGGQELWTRLIEQLPVPAFLDRRRHAAGHLRERPRDPQIRRRRCARSAAATSLRPCASPIRTLCRSSSAARTAWRRLAIIRVADAVARGAGARAARGAARPPIRARA